MRVEADASGFTLVPDSPEDLAFLHDARFRGVQYLQLLNLRPREAVAGEHVPCDGLRIALSPLPF